MKGVATLFDDTQQKAEYEDRLEGLVLFDPLPFDGIENIDDLTLREAAVWGCVYSIQETQGSFDNYNTDPDTEQLLLPSVDVDAYLAKLVGPSFKLTHKSFEMDDMTVAFDETTQCYKIPVTGSVGTCLLYTSYLIFRIDEKILNRSLLQNQKWKYLSILCKT